MVLSPPWLLILDRSRELHDIRQCVRPLLIFWSLFIHISMDTFDKQCVPFKLHFGEYQSTIFADTLEQHFPPPAASLSPLDTTPAVARTRRRHKGERYHKYKRQI